MVRRLCLTIFFHGLIMGERMQSSKHLGGMSGFTVVWLGQIVSVLASLMTQFALTIWAFEKTGSATALGLIQVFFVTPFLLISPLAGVLVDRHNRKLMMMVSDLGAGLATVGILVLQAFGVLEVWHLYVAAVINGLGNTFQWPAYSATISTMLPKEQYGRANGMMSLIEAGPGVIAPLIAGALLPSIGLAGILFIDVATFILAIGALLVVYIPQPLRTDEGAQGKGSLWEQAVYGFRYIFARPGLVGLLTIFLLGNLFSGIQWTLLAPMILSRTGNNEVIFGSVQSAGAIGGVIGGVLMSLWGGFKRRIHGVLLGWILASLALVFLGIGRDLSVWIPSMLIGALFFPLINSSSQAIWQAKVAPDLQGRVFTSRRLIAWLTQPVTPLIAGLLADYVMEPAMQTSSRFSQTFSGLVGSGPGAGMGLLSVFCCLVCALIGLSGYFVTTIRNLEDVLPDHDQLQKVEAVPAD
jgi:DHA3 family macrolide efflux protein-like MFS transporter